LNLAGSATLPGSPEQVWELFHDPARLARLLPGCERLEPDGPDRYRVAVKFGVAAIMGKYAGKVELSDKHPPSSMRIRLEGKGAPGFFNGNGEIHLLKSGAETEVRYSGEAQVGGLIASVGQRMMEAAAKKILQQFFNDAASELRRTK
jgi:uncharacterized protein